MGRFIVLVVVVGSLASAASAEWKEKVLYSFQGVPDGAVPAGGVVFDKAGNLYGATEDGGSSSCDSPGQCGTVYQLAPPTQKGGAWTETVRYVFKGHAYNDGATPEGGVLIDQAGNLYGTTGYGGSGPCTLLGGAVGCGTVYELSPPAKQGDPWTETVLYSFQGGNDGYVASGDLVFDRAGNLYGATLFGGGKGTTCDSLYGGQCGTVFKLSPPKTKGGKWTEKVLHSFAGIESGKQYGDGAVPNGGLTLDSKGAIYGTTYIGGYNCPHGEGQGCGTVFALRRPMTPGSGWAENVIHRFDPNSSDGAYPPMGLLFDSQGRLCGTTQIGGLVGYGTVFRLAPPTQTRNGWSETLLYDFTGRQDGGPPMTGLTIDTKGRLYGTALGGLYASGTVFRLERAQISQPLWTFGLLYSFRGTPDGHYPAANLIFNTVGSIYGTTQGGGGSGYGTVFQLGP